MAYTDKVVVLIVGHAGAGKSTLAKVIESQSRMSRCLAFADKIKKAVSVIFDIPRYDLDEEHIKKSVEPISGKTYREILQTLGTEWGRVCIDRDLWCKLTLKEVQEDAKNRTFIIQDCRFPNEVDIFKNSGLKCYVIKVERDNSNGQSMAHESEKYISAIKSDLTYRNALCERTKVVAQARHWLMNHPNTCWLREDIK